MGPEKAMEDLSAELDSVLQAMSKAKKLEDKLAYSQIVKNLCESLGVFLSLATDIFGMDLDDDDLDDDEF